MARKCVDCGQDIPAKRLTAVPNAVRCVPCIESAGDVAVHRDEPVYVPAYRKGPPPAWAWTQAFEKQNKE